MTEKADRVKDLETQIEGLEKQLEAKQEELTGTEVRLKTQAELTGKDIEQIQDALKEARWEEKLERVEKELVPLYREEREKEDKINRDVKALFNRTCKHVEKMNQGFKELEEIRERVSDIQKDLMRSKRGPDRQMRDAIEFTKAEVIREVPVTEQLEGGASLLRTVNIEIGIRDNVDDAWGKGFVRLPTYARNILEEVRRAAGRPVRATQDEMIRLAAIPDPRIIKAREELNKNMEILREKGLIVYDQEGDTLIVRDNTHE